MSDREEIESHLVKHIVDGEYVVGQGNQQAENSEFESYVSLLDSDREPKDYDWQSDIRIPEFASHVLTQSSLDVAQYFTTRDFVEVYLEDEGDQAKACAEAAKECINRTLNQRHLFHYQKFIRGKMLAGLSGRVYLKCWWEQETIPQVIGENITYEPLDVDVYGNKIEDETQERAMREVRSPIIGELPVIDRFNYDVYDPRNVFTDSVYTYSLQDKKWVIFRDEVTLDDLKAEQYKNGYFNIDKLEKEPKPKGKSAVADETYNKNKGYSATSSATEDEYVRLERYGKYWTIVDRDAEGRIIYESVKPGLDIYGNPTKNAELLEVIMTFVLSKSVKRLIGYKLTPFTSAEGIPYRPLIRGLCYLHPTEDGGVGDGKYVRELQLAIDDTFNVSQDRTLLATLPTMKIKKYSLEDNSSVYIQPGHPIELENPDDLVELKISDNIVGALNQIGMLTSKMQQVDAIQPPSMGQTPAISSTTATAVSAASQGTNIRSNYKSMTYENTVLCEQYWMILQMTYRFAKPITGLKLMGDKVYDFDPTKDYYYKPLSQSIETEYSKMAKRKEWMSMAQVLASIQHPDAPKMLNYILGEFIKLMGDEYVNFSDKFLDPKKPMAQGGQQSPQMSGPVSGPSNQALLPMSAQESMTREGSYGQ